MRQHCCSRCPYYTSCWIFWQASCIVWWSTSTQIHQTPRYSRALTALSALPPCWKRGIHHSAAYSVPQGLCIPHRRRALWRLLPRAWPCAARFLSAAVSLRTQFSSRCAWTFLPFFTVSSRPCCAVNAFFFKFSSCLGLRGIPSLPWK